MPAFPDEYERSVVDALPVHLERELRARARHYGMTENQFIVAMLGHIAWRTPFAGDVAPWEAWLPSPPNTRGGSFRTPTRRCARFYREAVPRIVAA